jgi:hypothetical protein
MQSASYHRADPESFVKSTHFAAGIISLTVKSRPWTEARRFLPDDGLTGPANGPYPERASVQLSLAKIQNAFQMNSMRSRL